MIEILSMAFAHKFLTKYLAQFLSNGNRTNLVLNFFQVLFGALETSFFRKGEALTLVLNISRYFPSRAY